MLDSRDPQIQALVVELAMSAEDAPTWEAIEDRASPTGPVARPALERSVPGWAVAVVAAVVALVSIGGTVLLVGPRNGVVQPPSTVVTTTMPPVTTTEPAVASTAAVEALVSEYHAAYNAGDVDRAIDLLSETIREVSPSDLRFWVEDLGERVDAYCIPSPEYPGGIVCAESYTDPLHGVAGLSLKTSFIYFERDGELLQTPDPGTTYPYPGCLSNRCPQAYDAFTTDLYTWLQVAHPNVAEEITAANRLKYFAADADAVAVALPFALEFVVRSPDWDRSGSPAISGMTPLEAVEAHYAALNSGDPDAYGSFFGEPAADGLLWLWEMGTEWHAQCAAVSGETNLVRCEEEMVDDFYTRAGAEFHYGALWSVSDGQMLQTREWEQTSAYWAYQDLEIDFGNWMRHAYADDHQVAFAGARLARNPEAAAIAVTRLDEFLSQSIEYPRSPDLINELEN